MFEPDDKKLEKIFEGERKGTLLAGEHKKDLAEKINKFLHDHNAKTAKLKGRLDEFMLKG